MKFIETHVFTRTINEVLEDTDYCDLQVVLGLRPTLGKVLRGSGGLRKLRWSVQGAGKRGGIRVIYFWDETSETFYMLFAFRKNDREDLTPSQLRGLARLVRDEFG